MRIALLQLDLTVGALEANAAAILDGVMRAERAGAELCVATELALCGYPPRDLVERPAFLRAVEVETRKLIDDLPAGMTLIFGTLDQRVAHSGRPVYNAAFVARRGEVLARIHKRLLPTYDVFDEDRYFEPGEPSKPVRIGALGVAVTVCEDAWNDVTSLADMAYLGEQHRGSTARVGRYRLNPVADLLESREEPKPNLLVNVSASPFTLPKLRARPQMFAEIARKYGVPLAFVNQVGGNDELLFDGRSTLFGADGAVLARAEPFAEQVLIADVPSSDPRAAPFASSIAPDLASEEEAAYRALVLGTRDYARKCGFRDAVVGLSGGIDSALVATIAADALGPDRVRGVAMPTRYSSEGSRTDARDLARNLEIRFEEIDIDPIFASYLEHLGARLDAVTPAGPRDVTFENVQARIRGAVLMALSNRTGALLLTTGNKSEVAVGYCTLYGDMAGGLAVISDVPKTMVYRLSRYVNRQGIRIPVSSIEKPPSAELRPNQTDQDTLPPYDVLDRILELFVEDGLGRDEIVAEGIPSAEVDRVLTMIRTNEYKRRQAAPGLILTKKAFGVGRRMPIAQRFHE
jgi:NAD+ synthetase